MLRHLIMCGSEARLVEDGQGFAIGKGGAFGVAIERAFPPAWQICDAFRCDSLVHCRPVMKDRAVGTGIELRHSQPQQLRKLAVDNQLRGVAARPCHGLVVLEKLHQLWIEAAFLAPDLYIPEHLSLLNGLPFAPGLEKNSP